MIAFVSRLSWTQGRQEGDRSHSREGKLTTLPNLTNDPVGHSRRTLNSDPAMASQKKAAAAPGRSATSADNRGCVIKPAAVIYQNQAYRDTTPVVSFPLSSKHHFEQELILQLLAQDIVHSSVVHWDVLPKIERRASGGADGILAGLRLKLGE
jgi:hypothetical protein